MLYNILKQKGDTVMPPKPKFSREDIINAAFDIVQKSGTDAMTAREVGNISALRQRRFLPRSMI